MAQTKQESSMATKIYGYIRVSTIAQDHAIQKSAIIDYAEYRKLNLLRIFEDKASGSNTERPGFQELHKALEMNPQSVDAVVVTKLDRLGRSLKDLLNITHWLDHHNIGLIIIESNIDTTTSEGRLFFHFMASIAEYERERILERTEVGRQAAKENGVQFGRRRKELSMRDIERKIFAGVPITMIAKDLKVSRATIYRRLEERKEAEREAVIQADEEDV
jgi:DNA invertase Pin-like site-specific DNA recombinase